MLSHIFFCQVPKSFPVPDQAEENPDGTGEVLGGGHTTRPCRFFYPQEEPRQHPSLCAAKAAPPADVAGQRAHDFPYQKPSVLHSGR